MLPSEMTTLTEFSSSKTGPARNQAPAVRLRIADSQREASRPIHPAIITARIVGDREQAMQTKNDGREQQKRGHLQQLTHNPIRGS